MPPPIQLLLASSNPGKLREYQELAGQAIHLAPLPGFASLPPCDESAATFAENAASKASHYSRFADLPVLADDSGLVVPALGGRPGTQSARYAGPNASDADRVRKLLEELRDAGPGDRAAQFVCVLALARRGRMRAVLSGCAAGEILDAPRGTSGFGYDPIFYFPPLGKSFAELSREEKNRVSHRGKAFGKLLAFLQTAA